MNKELLANTNLSHYRIVSKLGAGGMGEGQSGRGYEAGSRRRSKILPANVSEE